MKKNQRVWCKKPFAIWLRVSGWKLNISDWHLKKKWPNQYYQEDKLLDTEAWIYVVYLKLLWNFVRKFLNDLLLMNMLELIGSSVVKNSPCWVCFSLLDSGRIRTPTLTLKLFLRGLKDIIADIYTMWIIIFEIKFKIRSSNRP